MKAKKSNRGGLNGELLIANNVSGELLIARPNKKAME